MAGAAELFQSGRGIFKAYCSPVRDLRLRRGLREGKVEECGGAG